MPADCGVPGAISDLCIRHPQGMKFPKAAHIEGMSLNRNKRTETGTDSQPANVERWSEIYLKPWSDARTLRKVEELSGESLGLQDVLSEAGAEAATKAVRLTELEANMKHQQVQLVQVHPCLTSCF